jgi:hypothetical protein
MTDRERERRPDSRRVHGHAREYAGFGRRIESALGAKNFEVTGGGGIATSPTLAGGKLHLHIAPAHPDIDRQFDQWIVLLLHRRLLFFLALTTAMND